MKRQQEVEEDRAREEALRQEEWSPEQLFGELDNKTLVLYIYGNLAVLFYISMVLVIILCKLFS